MRPRRNAAEYLPDTPATPVGLTGFEEPEDMPSNPSFQEVPLELAKDLPAGLDGTPDV